MAVKVVCDFCDKPLEMEDGKYVIYHTKLVNTMFKFPYLCQSCAHKLDDIFADLDMLKNRNLMEKMKEINRKRREKLETTG